MNSTYGGGIIFFDVNGNSAAGVATLDNGLTLTGTNGQLGGVLIQNTTIDASNFPLSISSSSVNGGASVVASAGGLTLISVDAALNQKSILFDPLVPGIQVGDLVTGVGLVKDFSILAATQLADPNAYVTTDCLGSSIAGTLNNRLQTALNTTFTLYTVNATHDQLLLINIAFFLNSLGATTNVQVLLNYTDEGSTARSIQLLNYASLTTPVISPLTIYAQKNTAVTITVSLNIAGANYNIYANAQYLGVQNT